MLDPDLDRLAAELIVAAHVAPAATLGYAVYDRAAWRLCVGAAGRTPGGDADIDTVFDLASVTKPFVACSYAALMQGGALPRHIALGALLPEARGTTAEHLTLESLLSHRAGLVANEVLFAPLSRRLPFSRSEALRRAARARRGRELGPTPDSPLYSDLGYILAGAALEQRLARPLDALVRELVCGPLALTCGSARQWLAQDKEFIRRVAPTEHVPFRGGRIRGVVHDENAWALAGHGLAGHAGLFGTVSDVLRFGTALLDAFHGRSEQWLTPSTVRDLVAPRPGGSLRLGFDGKASSDSSAGSRASEETFGHLGFTGTSLWCDPAADVVLVLLTNRVCPTRQNLRIRAARPLVHDALFRMARPTSP